MSTSQWKWIKVNVWKPDFTWTSPRCLQGDVDALPSCPSASNPARRLLTLQAPERGKQLVLEGLRAISQAIITTGVWKSYFSCDELVMKWDLVPEEEGDLRWSHSGGICKITAAKKLKKKLCSAGIKPFESDQISRCIEMNSILHSFKLHWSVVYLNNKLNSLHWAQQKRWTVKALQLMTTGSSIDGLADANTHRSGGSQPEHDSVCQQSSGTGLKGHVRSFLAALQLGELLHKPAHWKLHSGFLLLLPPLLPLMENCFLVNEQKNIFHKKTYFWHVETKLGLDKSRGRGPVPYRSKNFLETKEFRVSPAKKQSSLNEYCDFRGKNHSNWFFNNLFLKPWLPGQ